MTRFRISWAPNDHRWMVLDTESEVEPVAAHFETLLEAETYVIERQTRSES